MKDESMPGAGGFGSDELFAQPRELITRFARNLFGPIDELAVQDDPVHIALAKRIPVRSEGLTIGA